MNLQRIKRVIHNFAILFHNSTKFSTFFCRNQKKLSTLANFVWITDFPCKKPLTNRYKVSIIVRYSGAPLAKLDIASVYGTEGQEFESLTVHQKSLIRIVSLLQMIGSDLLFISARNRLQVML